MNKEVQTGMPFKIVFADHSEILGLVNVYTNPMLFGIKLIYYTAIPIINNLAFITLR